MSIFPLVPKISTVTMGEYYNDFYGSQPTSVLVLPARNTTTAADAANMFRYSITRPLAERGFYVYPVHLVDAFFKSENIVDDQLIRNIPIAINNLKLNNGLIAPQRP